MLVIVGDDDYTGQTNGFGEHFSFVGPTIANLPVSSSLVTLNSSINSSFSSSSILSSSFSVISSSQNSSFGSSSNFSNLKSNFSSNLINTSVFNQNSLVINSSAPTSSIDKKNQNSQDLLVKEIPKQAQKPIEQVEVEIKSAEIKPVMTIRTGGLVVNNNLLYIGFLGLLFALIKTLAL
jgi:hypothetical protein